MIVAVTYTTAVSLGLSLLLLILLINRLNSQSVDGNQLVV